MPAGFAAVFAVGSEVTGEIDADAEKLIAPGTETLAEPDDLATHGRDCRDDDFRDLPADLVDGLTDVDAGSQGDGVDGFQVASSVGSGGSGSQWVTSGISSPGPNHMPLS